MDNNEITKKRGRPRKHKIEENKEKRSRGRPRKHDKIVEPQIKRKKGRPRKYSIAEKNLSYNGEAKTVIKKTDFGYLLKKIMNYFTNVLIIHNEISKKDDKIGDLFKKLKILDFQMVEVCKIVFANEFIDNQVISE